MAQETDLQFQTFDYSKDIQIAAPIDVTFDSVLAEIGPENEMPGGKPFTMKIEPWPGGRWYRDLGNNAGHFWGHVQVIKPPTLLEIAGPCFVSYPATNHIQYRLAAEGSGTRLTLTHRAAGYMPRDFIKGVEEGWEFGLKRIEAIAQRMKNERKEKAR